MGRTMHDRVIKLATFLDTFLYHSSCDLCDGSFRVVSLRERDTL